MTDDVAERHRVFHQANPHVAPFVRELVKDWRPLDDREIEWWTRARRDYLNGLRE